jgi:Protein of unknown function (DUF4235)
MKIFYKPFGIIAGIIGAKVGRRVFQRVWGSLDALAPPEPTAGDAPLPKVVLAAALEAATMAAIGAIVDRTAASAFHYLFGAWPGKTQSEKTAEAAED